MKTKNTLFLGSLLFLFCLSGFRLGAQSNGYYTFGINAGWSYQSSDVRIGEDGFGLGLTLGRSLFYRQGAPLAVDIRGRFLFARQYGLDPERSFDIANNTALNGSKGLDYTSFNLPGTVDEGYVFHNHRTTTGELSAELVFHFNRLRERTNFILSLYGAAGIDLYRVRLDQADPAGNEYYTGYNSIDPAQSRSDICESLQSVVLDGAYETYAETFEGGPKLDFMPSAGIEIGYALTPNFAVLLGHRITFSGTDLLDGNQWADPSNNDWYHYTSFGLEWRIWARGKTQRPPEITILQPTQVPFTTSNANPVIRAAILHVNDPRQISCNVNGRDLTFDFFQQDFTSRPLLRPGRNEVTITARNDAGMDRKKIIFILQGGGPTPPPPPPPGQGVFVRITQPSVSPFRTSNDQATIRADIGGVRSRSDIQVLINGASDNSFVYDPADDKLVTTIRLRPGQNNIEIRATGYGRTASDAVQIILGSSGNAPSVDFTYPANSPFQANQEAITLEATVRNINSRSDLSFRVNGRLNNSFTLNGNQFSATVRLSNGQNTFVLSASNPSGQDSDEVIVIKGAAGQAPVVNITRPSGNNATVSSRTYALEASVLNVNGKSDIKLTVNGNNTRSFNFSNGRLTASINLNPGSNTVVVQAFNASGSDQDQATIRYQTAPANNPPAVDITSPRNNTEVSNARINVQATLQNIDKKQQIELTVNGSRVTQFNYQANNGKLTAVVDLRPGSNTIQIEATNDDGTDSDQVSVSFDKVQPPIVQITAPDNGDRFDQQQIDFTATVQHVSNRNDIDLRLNGTRVTSFSLRGTRLSATLSLREGNNKIILSASNADGNDSDQVQVTYTKESGPKPTITFVEPNRPGQTQRQVRYSFQARVQNVSDREQLEITFNGQAVQNFQFQSRSGMITIPVTLRSNGRNTLEIEATNSNGKTSSSTYVQYRKQQNQGDDAPTVSIDYVSQPATNPFNPNVASSDIRASTSGVTSASQIAITLNGNPITDFDFTASNGEIEFELSFPRGSNVLRIVVSTSAGSDTAETTIDF